MNALSNKILRNSTSIAPEKSRLFGFWNTGFSAFLLLGIAGSASASIPEWQWNEFGSAPFSGQVTLTDDQGGAQSYQRYASGASPALFGAVSAAAPLMVVAGSNVTMDIVQAGTVIPKPTCVAPQVAKIFVTPVTACDSGTGSNLGGVHAFAEATPTTFIPRLSVWVQGYGWKPVNSHSCGMVKVDITCGI